MSEADRSLPGYIDRAIGAVRQLAVTLQPLGQELTATARLLSDTLGDPTRRTAALLLASLLDPIVTTLSLDIVVGLAASDRNAVLVRQVIGRLPYHEVLARVEAVTRIRASSGAQVG